MNNTFNIQRFGLLLKRQWLEFGKIYIISLIVVLGVFLSFYGISYYRTSNFLDGSDMTRTMNFREPLFIIMGFLFITVIASNYFAHLGQKSRAVIDLMIPASTFEKFVAGIFYTTVLGIIGYILLFYITDLLFISKLRSWYDASGNTSFVDGKKIEMSQLFPYLFTKNSPDLFKPIYIIPFFVTSVFLLGSIYFNKFHYIKTAISVMIFSGILSFILFKTGSWLFEGKIMIDQEDRNMNHMSQNTAEWLGVLLLVALTAIFWSITYVRLKEKEV
jgi:hypothetical protein